MRLFLCMFVLVSLPVALMNYFEGERSYFSSQFQVTSIMAGKHSGRSLRELVTLQVQSHFEGDSAPAILFPHSIGWDFPPQLAQLKAFSQV